jgi:hypothetical protein
VAGEEGPSSRNSEQSNPTVQKVLSRQLKRPREKAEGWTQTTSRLKLKLKVGQGKRLVVSKESFAKVPVPPVELRGLPLSNRGVLFRLGVILGDAIAAPDIIALTYALNSSFEISCCSSRVERSADIVNSDVQKCHRGKELRVEPCCFNTR